MRSGTKSGWPVRQSQTARIPRRQGVTLADITLTAFTLCNTLRVLAYLTKIAKTATDRNGAESISLATWALFLLSNISAIAYAVVNQQDHVMADSFLGNTESCVSLHFSWAGEG